ncbi:OB-fold nucleic acid binding domain-containing protein [Streptomyces sp. WMMC1477]|uniref:OB-fold nucleic acid binding domain-containing protein n=1 Tax=Streptomyces sp. WMMC1477 TaxID=3015155 RepID=UPI0022B722BD|nr:OB-fold nucleic acid binding domain-containing protein [Streptomyces sp. WMMC1477]MCZ7434120.1 OB-fold nucleic acid binding domain-containing protein [Streptomyces sp. WMMC1477]
MSGVNDSEKRGNGRIRRFLDRFGSVTEEVRRSEERVVSAAEQAALRDCTRICDCGDRQIVKVTGTLRTVTLRPRAGVPALEAELFDGSDSLDVVWLGRQAIAGIEPGRTLIASGRIAMNRGRRVLFNPKYELRPWDRSSG